MQIFLRELSYLHLISNNQISKDASKIRAITDTPASKNVDALRTFLEWLHSTQNSSPHSQEKQKVYIPCLKKIQNSTGRKMQRRIQGIKKTFGKGHGVRAVSAG